MRRFALPCLLLLLVATGCKEKPSGILRTGGVEIWVTVDTLHSVIGMPTATSDGRLVHEEWGYAERGWYLEHRQGCSGACRAMLWPSEAIVEETRSPVPFCVRTPDLPVQVWRFHVSESSMDSMRKALAREEAPGRPEVARDDGNGSVYFQASRSYHLFSHCHHFTARILRAGGIPVSRWSACTTGGLRRALGRLEESVVGYPPP